MKEFISLLLCVFCASIWSQELRVMEKKIAAGETRTSPYVFTITDGEQKYSYWHDAICRPDLLIVPLKKGDLFTYFTDCNLVVLDAAQKRIECRAILPQKISGVSWKDGHTLEVSLMNREGKFSQTCEIAVDGQRTCMPACSFLSSYSFDREDLAGQMRKHGLRLPSDTSAPQCEAVPGLEERLLELERFDPQNPWPKFFQGLHSYRETSEDEGRRHWQSLLESEAQWYHLLAMATELHILGETELGRAFHEKGMEKFLAAGFQPPMLFLLAEFNFFKGEKLSGKIRQLVQEGEWRQASNLLEECYEFAPRCEAFCGVMLDFAARLEEAGEGKLAQLWRDRAREARPFQFFGLGGMETFFALAFDVFVASIVAVVLLMLFLTLKSPYFLLGLRKMGMKRFLYRYWSRAEMVTMSFLLTISFITLGIFATSVRCMILYANLPVGGSVNLSHPEALEWIEQAPESPARHFYLGLAFQMRGNFEKARAEYAQAAEFPQTHNNLGLIARATGEEAAPHFEKALELDPEMPEAIWNTRGETSSSWAEVHGKYCPKSPMLAVPDGAIQRRFVYPSAWTSVQDLNSILSDALPPAVLWPCLILATILAFVSFCLPLLPVEAKKLPPTWWSSALVPGTGRYWSVLGGPVALLWFGSLFLLYQARGARPFFSLLEQIGWPPVERVYGIPGIMPDLQLRLQILEGAVILAVVLPCVNLILLVLERISWQREQAREREENPA